MTADAPVAVAVAAALVAAAALTWARARPRRRPSGAVGDPDTEAAERRRAEERHCLHALDLARRFSEEARWCYVAHYADHATKRARALGWDELTREIAALAVMARDRRNAEQ